MKKAYWMIFYWDAEAFWTLKPYDEWKYDSEEEALSVVEECVARHCPYGDMTILKFYTKSKN